MFFEKVIPIEDSKSDSKPLSMFHCPKFHSCNASICPLNPQEGIHRKGETVCQYLLDSEKKGAAEKYADDPVFPICQIVKPELVRENPDIGRQIKRASKSGFREDNLKK